jgi:predicted TIM-barrel fold metal-dependent hydrolase
MMIDIFPHIVPPKYLKALNKKAPSNVFIRKAMESSPTLTDLDIRFRIMDKYEGLMQVLTLGAPAIETVCGPKDAVELATIANDEMAELVAKYPDRFVAAVASLPMNDINATLKEVDRAITELRFRGIQIPSDVNGKPLDSPELTPLYEKMAYYNLPILIHPKRPSLAPDYPNEDGSKYAVFLIFGWPYDTTVAMTRLVFGGVFETYPNLKIITHHCGAMVPYFAHRIAAAYDTQEMRWGYKYEQNLTRRPLDYFRMFYADTAVSGSTAALMCGYAFFGADRMLFGTDMPYDSQIGDRYTRDTILSIERMDIPESEKKKIFEDNTRELFRLPI